MNAIELDLDDPTDLTRALVRIDSVNPDLVPGASGEAEIATFTNAWLTDRGFEVHTLEATPGRPTIVAVAKGTGGGDSIMLNGHLDTVSLASYENNEGLKDRISDGNIYGRGSFDMKSGVATCLTTAHTGALRSPSVERSQGHLTPMPECPSLTSLRVRDQSITSHPNGEPRRFPTRLAHSPHVLRMFSPLVPFKIGYGVPAFKSRLTRQRE